LEIIVKDLLKTITENETSDFLDRIKINGLEYSKSQMKGHIRRMIHINQLTLLMYEANGIITLESKELGMLSLFYPLDKKAPKKIED